MSPKALPPLLSRGTRPASPPRPPAYSKRCSSLSPHCSHLDPYLGTPFHTLASYLGAVTALAQRPLESLEPADTTASSRPGKLPLGGHVGLEMLGAMMPGLNPSRTEAGWVGVQGEEAEALSETHAHPMAQARQRFPSRAFPMFHLRLPSDEASPVPSAYR